MLRPRHYYIGKRYDDEFLNDVIGANRYHAMLRRGRLQFDVNREGEAMVAWNDNDHWFCLSLSLKRICIQYNDKTWNPLWRKG